MQNLKAITRLSFIAALALNTQLAFAADEGMIVFRDGFSVRFDDGFRQIAAALRGSSSARAVEVTSGSQTFLVNVSEIALLCRDRCSNLRFEGLTGGKGGSSDSNRASIAIEQNRFVVPQRNVPSNPTPEPR